MLGVHPVVDEDQLAVSLRFVSQAVFGAGSRRLESDLLPAHTIQTVTRPKITVEFKRPDLFLKLLDSLIGLSQQIVGGFRRQLPLIFRARLIGLAENGFFGLLSGEFCGRNRPTFFFFPFLRCFLSLFFFELVLFNLLLERRDSPLHVLRGLLVLSFELLKLLLKVGRLLRRNGTHCAYGKAEEPKEPSKETLTESQGLSGRHEFDSQFHMLAVYHAVMNGETRTYDSRAH